MKSHSFFLLLFTSGILISGCGSGHDRTPTETVEGFLDSAIKEGKPSLVAIEFCTEKAGKSYKKFVEISGGFSTNILSADYSEEKINGNMATVKVSTVKKKGEEVVKSESIFHLENEDGTWGIIGMQEEGDEKVIRFDGEEFAKMIEVMKEMNKALKKIEDLK